MNLQAIRVIYKFEMLRTWNTLMQSILSPVISTSLYFVVFGAAIGSQVGQSGPRQQIKRDVPPEAAGWWRAALSQSGCCKRSCQQ